MLLFVAVILGCLKGANFLGLEKSRAGEQERFLIQGRPSKSRYGKYFLIPPNHKAPHPQIRSQCDPSMSESGGREGEGGEERGGRGEGGRDTQTGSCGLCDVS